MPLATRNAAPPEQMPRTELEFVAFTERQAGRRLRSSFERATRSSVAILNQRWSNARDVVSPIAWIRRYPWQAAMILLGGVVVARRSAQHRERVRELRLAATIARKESSARPWHWLAELGLLLIGAIAREIAGTVASRMFARSYGSAFKANIGFHAQT